MPDGCLLPSTLQYGNAATPDLTLRPAWYDSIEFSQIGLGWLATDTIECGVLVEDVPLDTLVQNNTGCLLPGYSEVFYNRFVITPDPLEFGNITSDQSRQLTVWNGFFEPKTLLNVTELNLEGISIVGPVPPTVYTALQEIVYDVNAEVDEGPPIIDGSYTFIFEVPLPQIIVEVTGTRVVAFPYLFQPGMRENISWNTQVMTSNNGYEQRTQLRDIGRQEFSATIAIPNGQISQLDSLFYGWRTNNFALPISSECRNITAPTATDSPEVQCSTEYASFVAGGLAILYQSPKDFELLNVASFTATTITADTNISKVWDTSTLIMPVRVSRLLTSPRRDSDGQRQEANVKFQVVENFKPEAAAPVTQYKGLDVFVDHPLTLGDFINDTYNARVDVIDYQTGVISTFAPWLKTKIDRKFGLQFDDPADVWAYRQWLYRRAGKWRPFWMPTFEANFTLVTTGFIDSEFVVENDGQLGLSDERNDLAVLTDAGWLLRGIVLIETDGDNLKVTVDFDLDVDASEIITISWLGRKRLTSDNLTIAWNGNDTSSAVVPITEINN